MTNAPAKPPSLRVNKSWTDPNTARLVRQLTDFPKPTGLSYFRFGRHLKDGRIIGFTDHGQNGNLLAIDPASGDVEPLPCFMNGWAGKFYDKLGLYYEFHPIGLPDKFNRHAYRITRRNMPYGELEELATLPVDAPGHPHDITCDGKTLILVDVEQDLTRYPLPTTMDLASFWGFFSRPRRSAIWAWDLATQTSRKIYETHGLCVLHIDCSPIDPGLVRFAQDMFDAYTQRCWTIRIDGSSLTKIHPQRFGDLVTHEFWWSDPSLIGYTYQDRTQSTTLHTHPWAEYSPEQTRLGIADLSGKPVYISDPLNCYHTHIYRSPCGRFVSGEGTHDHSTVYSAHFNIKNTRIDMVPLATVRTPYVPFRGQWVETSYSPDSQWVLYNEKIGENHQIMCVKNDI